MGGGYIVIGIKESNGRALLPPVGLNADKIDHIQKELLNLCNRLTPHYFPIVEPVVVQEKHILIIWVPGGQNRPYKAPETLTKKSPYTYYIRRYSATVKAQFEDEKELISLAGTIPFDDRINHPAELEDLKLPMIKSYLKEVGSDLYKDIDILPFKQLCRQMVIVDGPDEYLKPRNVGVLLFNDIPQKFIPMSQIEVVEFKTTPADDQLTEKIFQGPIQQQISDVLTYLKNVFLKEYIHKQQDRAEAERFFNYPYVALKESIVNAIYHRGYEIREPVEIRIHPGRIEILSYPGPDRSIKKEDMEKGIMVARRYRNRRIGEFFKELKLTEGKCTGIPKTIRAMKVNGSPPPVFKTDEERTYFITILEIHPKAVNYNQTGEVDIIGSQKQIYDIFISYKSDSKPWVRVLAQNLKTQGFKVFFDEWELVPGQSIVEGMARGLKQSRKGILVVTPEAIDSGWAKEELEQMALQKKRNLDFSIIPLVLGKEIPDFPFFEDILWIDFRTPGEYRQSFYRLVCAIENRKPGPETDFKTELKIPMPRFMEATSPGNDEISFIEKLFEMFYHYQAICLLTQADRWQGGVRILLMERARVQFGEKNVIHLVPPFGQQDDMGKYFSLLGKQSGFTRAIDSSVSLLAAFEERLLGGEPIFLMVSGFENSSRKAQEEIASVLRALNERFYRELRILICGGEKLADLSYSGELSYLNDAKILEWPDLTVSDVHRMINTTYPHLINIDNKMANKLLSFSGGHPVLLKHCIELCSQNPGFTIEEFTDILVRSPVTWKLFMPFIEKTNEKQQICQLLEKNSVGPIQPYLYDPLLKRLYWRNLLKKDTSLHRLYWRSEALRLAGKRILECK